jgi:hypothetical protein
MKTFPLRNGDRVLGLGTWIIRYEDYTLWTVPGSPYQKGEVWS